MNLTSILISYDLYEIYILAYSVQLYIEKTYIKVLPRTKSKYPYDVAYDTLTVLLNPKQIKQTNKIDSFVF